jgi:hypothetical protein
MSLSYHDWRSVDLPGIVASAAVYVQTTTDTDFSFKLLAALSQLLGASPHQFRSVRDFDDATFDIIKAAVVALREEDKTFLGSSLQDLIQHTVNALFGEVGKQFDHLPSAGTSKPHTHGQFKTAHLGLVVPARIGYLEGAAFR